MTSAILFQRHRTALFGVDIGLYPPYDLDAPPALYHSLLKRSRIERRGLVPDADLGN